PAPPFGPAQTGRASAFASGRTPLAAGSAFGGRAPTTPQPPEHAQGPAQEHVHATGPMHARPHRAPSAFDDLQLMPVPRVARLEPIRPRRWPWVASLVVLLAIGVGAFYAWPRYGADLLPDQLAALRAASSASHASRSSTPSAPVVSPSSTATSPAPAPDASGASSPPTVKGQPATKGLADADQPAVAQAVPAPAASTSSDADQKSAEAEQKLRTTRQAFDA